MIAHAGFAADALGCGCFVSDIQAGSVTTSKARALILRISICGLTATPMITLLLQCRQTQPLVTWQLQNHSALAVYVRCGATTPLMLMLMLMLMRDVHDGAHTVGRA